MGNAQKSYKGEITMPRKGENIYKRKDGRWEGRYLKKLPDGTSKYGYVYAATYRDARDKLRRAAALWAASPRQEGGDQLLLKNVAQRWEASIAQQVKESTLVKYHTTVHNHILPELGAVCVEDMTHELIESFALKLMRGEGRSGRVLSPRSAADVIGMLRSILRYARRCGAVVPCDGSSVRIRRKKPEIRVLTRAEQEKLCAFLYRDLDHKKAGILLSLYSGLRVGEVCALRWEDISLEEGIICVRHTLHRLQNLSPEGPRTKLVITEPKSGSSVRLIPMPEALANMLSLLPGQRRGFFLTCREDKPCEPRVMQYTFHKYLRAAGVADANYHALRHTFATRCVELGFDVKSLSELLGHATVGMTLDRYVHPTIEHKREHIQRLSGLMTML